MTSPNSVGEVSVEMVADVTRFAKRLKAAVEKAFRDLDIQAAIDAATAGVDVHIPVSFDLDTSELHAKLKAAVKAAAAPASSSQAQPQAQSLTLHTGRADVAAGEKVSAQLG
jgi:hypothetical protein